MFVPAVSLGAWFGTWVEKRLGITGVGLLAGRETGEQCSVMVPEMRGLSPCHRLPEPALCPAAGGSPEPEAAGRRCRHVLALPEEEAWRPQQCALLEADASDEAGMLPASPRAAGGFDNFFLVQEGEGPGWEGGSSPFLPVSPEVMKRRRGGIIEQRDIIKAHEAHKMQSTPQARRKEWE
ncbi:hypothetical protein R6Z07F_011801 [Ovis aries]